MVSGLAGVGAALLLTAFPPHGMADGAAADQFRTKKSVHAELLKIEDRLTAIEKNQGKILEGQAKLSEEHKQLRYWIHRK